MWSNSSRRRCEAVAGETAPNDRNYFKIWKYTVKLI